jgi:hypothetical protein
MLGQPRIKGIFGSVAHGESGRKEIRTLGPFIVFLYDVVVNDRKCDHDQILQAETVALHRAEDETPPDSGESLMPWSIKAPQLDT